MILPCPGQSVQLLEKGKLNDLALLGERIELPLMYTQTTTGYVRRLLSPKEVLSAMNLPSTILRHATKEEKEGRVQELRVHFKGRFELVRSLNLAVGGDPQPAGTLFS